MARARRTSVREVSRPRPAIHKTGRSMRMPRSDDENKDGALMARFYGCEGEAFEQLTQQWWGRLFGFFRGLGFSEEDAEDLSVVALVRLAATKDATRKARRFDVDRPLAPFLLTLARNAAIEKWRERPRDRP